VAIPRASARYMDNMIRIWLWYREISQDCVRMFECYALLFVSTLGIRPSGAEDRHCRLGMRQCVPSSDLRACLSLNSRHPAPSFRAEPTEDLPLILLLSLPERVWRRPGYGASPRNDDDTTIVPLETCVVPFLFVHLAPGALHRYVLALSRLQAPQHTAREDMLPGVWSRVLAAANN
jgi:hypothetical protein